MSKEALRINDKSVRDKVISVINNSPDLITALESVGAMYNIPSTNFIEDDTLKTIRVNEDKVIAPSNLKAKENTQAIICAIGAVLDNISERIDRKLDEYQTKNIETSKNDEDINNRIDQSKGTVLAMEPDANGDMVIIYDSGYVDMTKSQPGVGIEKAKELRERFNLQSYTNPDSVNVGKVDYFTDEDDITQNLETGNDGDWSDGSNEPTNADINNVSSSIGESATFVDLVGRMNNTTHLGYDLLSSQGFEFVKHVQESASSKKNKEIKPDEIKHMKFDNTNIIKAIKYFNAARDEQKEITKGNIDFTKFINSQNYQKAIDCLNKQFNARIVIRFFDGTDYPDEYTLYTVAYQNELMSNITLSKSKGFQMNGKPCNIFCLNRGLDSETKNEHHLFGQHVVASILHELFHNIYCTLYRNETVQYAMLTSTISLALSTKKGKSRRVIISNYVNTLAKMGGNKMNILQKRRLIKRISMIVSFKEKEDKSKNKVSENLNAEDDVKRYINQANKIIKMNDNSGFFKRLCKIVIGIILSMTIVGLPAGIMYILDGIGVADDLYKNHTDHEEYWCDLFAGMYQLPVNFLIGSSKGNNTRRWTSNEVNEELLREYTKVNIKVHEVMLDVHPSEAERNFAAVKIAKQLLETKHVDPSIKEYCQWIVDNHSNILKTDVEELYNSTTFDPKTADDLDKHLENIINTSNITLTESYINSLMNDDTMIGESTNNQSNDYFDDDRRNLDGEQVPSKCPKCGHKVDMKFVGNELVYVCSNKSCDTYFGKAAKQ